jgi:hypothetical protein|tara:strand:+ start:167 stop:667 length:501 start_codon:yes stop_codon:yes gene_type:complete
MKIKKGQQEMVGFVLIVVLVVVALMVFLILSFKSTPEKSDSLEVENLISSIMKMTTECAIVFEPDYDDYEDLFKSCYNNKDCKNLGIGSCEYLNSSLKDLMDNLMEGENVISYYEMDFSIRDDIGLEGILRVDGGNCTGKIASSSQKSIKSRTDNLIIRLKLCREA